MSERMPPVRECQVGVSLALRADASGGLQRVPYFLVLFAKPEDAHEAQRAVENRPVILAIYRDATGFRYVVERDVPARGISLAISGLPEQMWECHLDVATHNHVLDALCTSGRWMLAIGTGTRDAQAVVDSRRFALRFDE